MPKAWYKDSYRRRWLPIPHELLKKEKDEFLALIFDGIDEVEETGDLRLCKDVIVHAWVYLKLNHRFNLEQCIRLIVWLARRVTADQFLTYEELRFNFTLLAKVLSSHRPIYGLVLPWKPFYQLLDLLYFQKNRVIRNLPAELGTALVQFIAQARSYFDEDIGEQLLVHCRPYLVTDDGTIYYGQMMLVLFLPTLTVNGLRWGTPRKAAELPIRTSVGIHTGSSLDLEDGEEEARVPMGRTGLRAKEKFSWVDEVMAVWQWVEHSRDWDSAWLSLIARVACNASGSPSNLLQSFRVARKRAIRDRRKELVQQHDDAAVAGERDAATHFVEPTVDRPEVLWTAWEDMETVVKTLWGSLEKASFLQWLGGQGAAYQHLRPLAEQEQRRETCRQGMVDGDGDAEMGDDQDDDRQNHAIAYEAFDWEPYKQELYKTMMKMVSYDIPLGTGELLDPFDHGGLSDFMQFFKQLISNPHDSMAGLLVYFMTPCRHEAKSDIPRTGPPSAMQFLAKLMRYLEPYFHPSNYGNWQQVLGKLVASLCLAFARRIGNERRYVCRLAKFRRELESVLERARSELTGDDLLQREYLVAKLQYVLDEEEVRQEKTFLDEADINEFVACVLSNVMKGIYSKHGDLGVAAMESMQSLAYLAPSMVLPPMLANIENDLQTLTQTHRTQSALFLLSYVARVVMSPQLFRGGVLRLESLLRLSLPGVDPNDTFKTYMTFRFFYAVSYSAPIVDCDYILPQQSGESEAVRDELRHSIEHVPSDKEMLTAARQCTAYFADWAIQLVERILTHFDCTGYSKKVTFERAVQDLLLHACELLFQQVDTTTYNQLLKRVFEFVTTNFIPDAREPISQLCGYLAKPYPNRCLDDFIPFYYEKIVERGESGPSLHKLSNNELLWSMSMLKNVVKFSNTALLTYKRELTEIVELILFADEQPVPKEGRRKQVVSSRVAVTAAKMLRNMLKSVSGTYIVESRCLTPDQWAAALSSGTSAGEHTEVTGDGEQLSPDLQRMREQLLFWGSASSRKDLQISWHKPSRDELSWAIELCDRFGSKGLAYVHEFIEYFSRIVCETHAERAGSAMDVEDEESESTAMDVDEENGARTTAARSHSSIPISRRQQLQKWLRVLYAVITGATEMLHHDELVEERDQSVEEAKTVQDFGRPPLFIKLAMPQPPVTSPSLAAEHPDHLVLQITRKEIGEGLTALCEALLQPGADFDDTKVLKSLIDSISAFLMHRSAFSQGRYTKTQAKLKLNKHRNPVLGPDDVPRHLQTEAVSCFFMKRVLYHQGYCGALQLRMLTNLVGLSLHPYSEVRKLAQSCLNRVVLHHNLPLSSLVEVPLQLIQSAEAKRHEVVGSCYLLELLLPSCCKHIPAHRDWPFLQRVIVALCSGHVHSDTKLHARIMGLLNAFLISFPQVQIARHVGERQSEEAVATLRKESEANSRIFVEILQFLCALVPTVTWSYQLFCLQFVSRLLQRYEEDVFIPECVASCLLQCLATDVISVRELAVEGLSLLLVHLKVRRPRFRTKLPLAISAIQRSVEPMERFRGAAQSDEAWEQTDFEDSSYLGWNGMPSYVKHYRALDAEGHKKRILVSKGEAEEEGCNRLYSAQLRKLRASVSSVVLRRGYWEAVVLRWSHESREEGSGFYNEYAELFKGLFQLFFSDLLEVMRPLITTLCSGEAKREEQAIGAEILAGLVRGSKHWPFGMREEMHAFVLPLIMAGILHSDSESGPDWQACLSFCVRDRDMRRISWLITPLTEGLKDFVMAEKETTVVLSRRLESISSVLTELTWRGARLAVEVVTSLMPDCLYRASAMLRFPLATLLCMAMADTFQGIREPVTKIPVRYSSSQAEDARIEMFPALYSLVGQFVSLLYSWEAETAPSLEVQAERNCVTKTALLALLGSFGGAPSRGLVTLTFPLLPLMFRMANHEDEEVQASATECVNLYAMSEMDGSWLNFTLQVCYQLLHGTFVPGCLQVPVAPDVALLCRAAANVDRSPAAVPGPPSASPAGGDRGGGWRQKLHILRFFQVVAFRNVFLLSKAQLHELLEVLIELLCDAQVEVRSLASVTLSGMLAFVDEDVHLRLVERFTEWAETHVPRRKTGSGHHSAASVQMPNLRSASQAQLQAAKTKAEAQIRARSNRTASSAASATHNVVAFSCAVRLRHSGVLGIAAIVRAYPYRIPSWMPDLLVRFAGHINDRMPINATVKEAFLEFWRVHQDAWTTEQLLFSDEQLSFLTELLVAPTYFA